MLRSSFQDIFRHSSPGDLAEKIARLQADRAEHLAAIQAIDDVLEKVRQALALTGQIPDFEALQAPSPAPPAPLPPRRTRGKFSKKAEESVLEFIQQRGNPQTAEINAHWRAEGRKGTANVTILKLLHQGLIRRQADPSVRGSRYVAQKGASPRASRAGNGKA